MLCLNFATLCAAKGEFSKAELFYKRGLITLLRDVERRFGRPNLSAAVQVIFLLVLWAGGQWTQHLYFRVWATDEELVFVSDGDMTAAAGFLDRTLAAMPASLKREIVEGLDIMFVRELTGGVYFGEPRGITDLGNGERRGVNTQVYTSSEIRRVARVAFELAAKRSGRVCSAEKSNVMESGLLWREEVQALRDAEYPHIDLSHMLADNTAMQLVKFPKQFDVILTDNLFGDILSDEAAMLTGSLGMLPSAALGAKGMPGLYEPIHGSAPDIAGKGLANPCASILSLALALRYSLDRSDLADRVEGAVATALDRGARSGDIGGSLGTAAMGDAVLAAL